MDDLKQIIAKNLSDLRQKAGLTQQQLAEHLHYSDKAVSKWERGESVPDVAVLKQVAGLFGVGLDYLTEQQHDVPPPSEKKRRIGNYVCITVMSVLLVWLIALLSFVIIELAPNDIRGHWLAFVYAVPASLIVWLVLNAVWFDHSRIFLIVSLLLWSMLLVVYLTLWTFGYQVWLIFLLGIPAQGIILSWSRIRIKKEGGTV